MGIGALVMPINQAAALISCEKERKKEENVVFQLEGSCSIQLSYERDRLL